jgi:RNA polymerase sigma-70 factor (ECF subfamily)
MSDPAPSDLRAHLDTVYRAESGRILATLVRLLGNLGAAEDAMHDAFNAALQAWPATGIPANPRAWADLDRALQGDRRASAAARASTPRSTISPRRLPAEAPGVEPTPIDGDELAGRPAAASFSPAATRALARRGPHVALTLREVCGLTTEAIASAFLRAAADAGAAHRASQGQDPRRARSRIEVPAGAELPRRLRRRAAPWSTCVFNEGYSASSGDAVLTRASWPTEAIRLLRRAARTAAGARGRQDLLALMLLQNVAPGGARDADGDLVRLERQDRSALGPRR